MYRLSISVCCALFFLGIASRGLAQGPRWLETHSWKGNGTRQTEVFQVYGERWTIRHNHDGDGVLTVDLYDGAGNRQGKPVLLKQPGPGAASLEGRGAHCLVITGPQGSWDVRIAQYLTPAEEWFLTQQLRKGLPPLKKKALWIGTGGSEEHQFTVKTAPWRIRWTNLGYGRLTLSVRDNATWTPELFSTSTETGVAESWGHHPGTFTVRLEAVPTDWQVEVFGE